MLKITKLEGYAFLILTHMAKRDLTLMHSAKELSANCDLPLPTVSKVLKVLAGKGILSSYQGSRGGYVLTKKRRIRCPSPPKPIMTKRKVK